MSDPSARDRTLDARLREQVAALHQAAASGAAPLPAEAQARVRAQLGLEAARLRAEHKRRAQLRAATAGVLLAAAAALVVYLRAPHLPAPAVASRPGSAEPACALPLLDDAALAADGGKELALGALGSLVTQPQTRLHVDNSSRCELALRLDAGTLAGDLHSLRPARLVIRTAQGEVIVTGTRFSVRSDAGLEVLLASGVVDVHFSDRAPVRLLPGSRLRRASDLGDAQTEPLTAADTQRLSSWLEPPRAATAAVSSDTESPQKPSVHAPSSTELLATAEAARRAERYPAARDAYRSASLARDATAEVALLRWARMELELRTPSASLRLLDEHTRRFKHGSLGAEAGWLEVQTRRALGQTARAEQAARKLSKQHAGTPQAAAASQLLDNP